LAAGGAAVYLMAGRVDATRTAKTRADLVETFGGTMRFVADVGRLPASLGELTSRGSLPATTTATGGVQIGWAGPYVWKGFDAGALAKDRWGRSLRYGAGDGLLAGQLASAGADGSFGTTDDINYPTGATTATGSLRLDLVILNVETGDYDTNPTFASDEAQATSATLYYPSAGVETSTTIATSLAQNPPYTFASVPRGAHALVVTSAYHGASPAMTTTVIVPTQGNGVADRATVRLAGTSNYDGTCTGNGVCTCPPASNCTLACGLTNQNNCTLNCDSANTCAFTCKNNCNLNGDTGAIRLTGSCNENCETACGAVPNCIINVDNNGDIDCGTATNCTVTCGYKCNVDCHSANCNITCAKGDLNDCGGGRWACGNC
jgi:hypothetical protein